MDCPGRGSGALYQKGVSSQDVPDMPPSGQGAMTFYYTNQQSNRLMFYHDHALGITRLNVYAGEAAGYLIVDPYEEDLIDGTNDRHQPDWLRPFLIRPTSDRCTIRHSFGHPG